MNPHYALYLSRHEKPGEPGLNNGNLTRSEKVAIDGQTQLVGVIGWPTAHSLSPAMHNAAFSYMGLNWRYIPLPVRREQLPDAMRGLAALGFRGINVTVPHKVDVIPMMDSITEAVTIVGAVNTIRIDRNTGKMEGM